MSFQLTADHEVSFQLTQPQAALLLELIQKSATTAQHARTLAELLDSVVAANELFKGKL